MFYFSILTMHCEKRTKSVHLVALQAQTLR
jgi:hypothetical protein